MTETAVLDRAALDGLLESVGGDQDFLAELIDTYLADAPSLIAAMRDAAAAGDSEALRRGAHSLKSNSASFGAETLARLSRELEELGRSGSMDGAGRGVRDIEAEYERVRRALLELRRAA